VFNLLLKICFSKWKTVSLASVALKDRYDRLLVVSLGTAAKQELFRGLIPLRSGSSCPLTRAKAVASEMSSCEQNVSLITHVVDLRAAFNKAHAQT